MRKFITIFCLTLYITFSVGTTVKKCSYSSPPSWVDLNGCKAGPCVLRRGQQATVKIEFTSPIDSASLKPQVIANYYGQKYPIQLSAEQNNACNSLTTGNCPIKQGGKYSYQMVIPIDRSLPLVKFNVEFSLRGDNNANVFCFLLDVRISL